MRFAGGAVAPWLAGKLAEWVAPDNPFFVGAAAVAVAFVVLIVGRRSFLEEPEVEVEVLHVHRTEVFDEEAVDRESRVSARATVPVVVVPA